MREEDFIAANQDAWATLESLAKKAREQGFRDFAGDELREMHARYLQASSDLAFAQTHYPDSPTTTYLNSLVAGAYAQIYTSKPRRVHRIIKFLILDYPRLVRARGREIALATAVFLGMTALGYVLPFANPRLSRALLPDQVRETIVDQLEKGQGVAHVKGIMGPAVSSTIMVNNIQVSFVAFAGGILLGTLTVYTLATNGLLLGGLGGTFAKYGFSLIFWSLILPHGILELPAIWITAGAGLVIGKAIVRPGNEPRSVTIRHAANDAARLLLGTIPIFVVAGIVEAFFTPVAVSEWIKLLVAAALGMALAAYLTLAGRRAEGAS